MDLQRALAVIEEVAICLVCGKKDFVRSRTYWKCRSCGHTYPCVHGIPELYIERNVGESDKLLRDKLYDGLLGRYYNFVMPFLSLPARPIRSSLWLWGVYFLLIFSFGILSYYVARLAIIQRFQDLALRDGLLVVLFLGSIFFCWQYPYIGFLMLLAVPVKISLLSRRFQPGVSFREVHATFQEEYRDLPGGIRMLDIATGGCNSLYRHGWMDLNAEYVGIDLSEQMLRKGLDFISRMNIGIELALADAHQLPFETDSFDIVTCYGAVNGYTNISKALSEMVRVTKQGGKILFLDEQLYGGATLLERRYFESVLSSHDIVRRCPVEMLPSGAELADVYQVYQFYYICVARKQRD